MEKKVFRSIHGGSLSFCKCWRARINELAGRIGSAGRSLPMSVLNFFDGFCTLWPGAGLAG